MSRHPHPSCSRVSIVESTVPLSKRTRSVELFISAEDAIDLSPRVFLFVICGICRHEGGRNCKTHGAVSAVIQNGRDKISLSVVCICIRMIICLDRSPPFLSLVSITGHGS